MPVQVTCSCGQKLKAPDKLAGKTVRCPKCKEPLSIPALPDLSDDLELEDYVPPASAMDDLFASELPATPAGPSPLSQPAPQPTSRKRPVASKSTSDGIPPWMLWAAGGMTAVLLLGLGTAMLLTSMRSGGTPEDDLVAGAAADAAPDENVAKAFAEKDQRTNGIPTPAGTKPAESTTSGASDGRESSSKTKSAPATEQLTAEALAQIDEDLREDDQEIAREWGIDPEELKEIKATLVTLNEISQRQATDELETAFDLERGLEECEQRGYVKNIALVEPERVAQNFRNLISSSIFPILIHLDMKESDVRFAAISEDGQEAEVIMEVEVPRQYRSLKLRWWLTKEMNQWRVYDLELLQLGIRQSALMVLSFARTDEEIAEQRRALKAVHALNRAWQTKNNNTLGRALYELDEAQVSGDIDTLRHILRGRWHHANGDFEKALSEFKIVEQRSPQTTLIYLLQAASLTHLGRYQTALKQIQEYERRLGRDDESWGILGFTLYAAGEKQQGLAAFQKGMQYNSNSVSCLTLMAEALDGDNFEPMRPYIVESALPLPAFQQLATNVDELGYKAAYDFLLKARRESQKR